MATPLYDILVYGATGFTGRQVARYLDEHAPAGLRLAIAGRTPAKLLEIAATLRRKDIGLGGGGSAKRDTGRAVRARSGLVRRAADPHPG